MELRKEKWRHVVGWEGYYVVSNYGRVKSLARSITNTHGYVLQICGRILKSCVGNHGYFVVGLTRGGYTQTFTVHRLVLEAFRGPCPEGMEALHRNGKKKNINLYNLHWGKPIENGKDRIKHGHSPRGERQGGSKLTIAKVRLIRSMYAQKKMNQTELAKKFLVCQNQISKIVRREAWGWL